MYYERLMIEPTDDGWIRFSCPDRSWAGESANSLLKLKHGFNYETILEVVPATGWTEKRDGQWRIQSSRSCRDLVRLLDEMLEYFDGPDEPNQEFLRIKKQVDSLLSDDSQIGAGLDLSQWHYARLDNLLRENLADSARSLDGIWVQADLQLDVADVRSMTIREFCRDFQLSELSARRMAPSARTPANVKEHGRNVG